MPPSTFSCPICKGTVTAASHPEAVGAISLACDGECHESMLNERCRAQASLAFKWREDLLVPLPGEAIAALLAGVRESKFFPGMRAPLSQISKMASGATRVREHLVHAPDGSVLFLILRFEYPGDRKEFCQFHCVRNSQGALTTKVGLPAGPWPLVGLRELSDRPNDPVLIVEGESTLEAATEKLPDFVVCTSMCGAENPHITDWSPLRGRDVTIMPDNDEAGAQYARAVAAQAIAEGATSVRIAKLPEAGLPQKWDLADPLPPGLTMADVAGWIRGASLTSWAVVRDAYRSFARLHHTPPFRLPDGHLAGVRHAVEGLAEALEHIDAGCSRQRWLRILSGIYHAVGHELGLPIAKDWSRSGPVEHGKFDEQDWPAVFDAIAASPPRSPMPLRAILWEAKEQSKVRAEKANRSNSEGWEPSPELMAEANLADFESRHRAVLRGEGLEVATQRRLEDGRYTIDIRSQKAAEALYRSKKTFNYDGKPVKALNFWLDNQRLPVLHAIFRPGQEVSPNEYNLFRGLSVQPKQGAGSYRLFRELLDRVCRENGDDSDFIWKLIAWRLQNLDALVPSALVLVGPEGSFKSTIADIIAELLAPYSLTISDPGKFVGRFNAQLFGKLFVQLEEVSLGKDETLDSRMKHFVNGKMLDLEEKGQPAFSIENRLFIAITSNKRDVIRISPSSRRYAAYWVKDAFEGDEEKRSAHWLAMRQELEGGGFEALMHDLLNIDLTDFNPRLAPRTPFFYELAGISSDRTPHIAWWQDVLESRDLPPAAGKPADWSAPVPVDGLYRSYLNFCEANGAAAKARTLSMSAWAREMGKLIPGGLNKKRLAPSEGRKAVYFFPPYEECCDAFDRAQRVTVDRSAAPAQEQAHF
jgi:hypothetical protein